MSGHDNNGRTQAAEDVMPGSEDVISINLSEEIDRYFADDSKLGDGEPLLVIVAGGIATGKTRLRREKFATGYVLVDAADIFIRLSRGKYYDFPDGIEEPMDLIGRLVASRAVRERRNIVTEITGSDLAETTELIESMKSAGYKMELVGVTCPVELAIERNMSRGDDNISSYYTEPYNRRWLIEAARENQGGSRSMSA